MQGTLTTISPDGHVAMEILDGPPGLERLQELVGGYIEAVPGLTKREDTPCVAFVNEEGILKGLPLNTLASEIWAAAAPQMATSLVGTMVVIEGDEELLGAL